MPPPSPHRCGRDRVRQSVRGAHVQEALDARQRHVEQLLRGVAVLPHTLAHSGGVAPVRVVGDAEDLGHRGGGAYGSGLGP